MPASLSAFGTDDSYYGGSRIFWSKAATLALKGDAYIWSGNLMGGGTADFTTAKTALGQIAALGTDLEPSISNLWGVGNEGNTEFIFAMQYKRDEASNLYNSLTGRSTEINPQFVGVVPPSDVIIATTFEVEFESASGTIMVVIPYSTIEPIKQKLSSSFQTDNDIADTLWTTSMNGHLQGIVATAIVKLGEAEMTVGDLVNLNVGDVITLDREASGEVVMEVEGVEKMTCLMGNYKGNKAVQLKDRLGI